MGTGSDSTVTPVTPALERAALIAWWIVGQSSAKRPPDHRRTRSEASMVDIGTDTDIVESCELNGLLEAMSSYTTRRELRIARAHDR